MLIFIALYSVWARIKINTSLAAKGALANRLQYRTACKIQNGRQGAPKWQVFGRSRQLSLNKFFDPSTPSMRKGRDGEKNGKKNGKNGGKKKKKIQMKIVATTSLPAVDRLNTDRWNAARSRQNHDMLFLALELFSLCLKYDVRCKILQE